MYLFTQLRNVAVIAVAVLLFIPQVWAKKIVTVGPGTTSYGDFDFLTIDEAIAYNVPFTDDEVIEVYVGRMGTPGLWTLLVIPFSMNFFAPSRTHLLDCGRENFLEAC